ncbi:MAG TPA: type II secretion system protein GspD, partial [Candidatus Krumholzibacteria bacterium]|nr:type II secretion system protein GspD [Candidatus Krumholzibacteria bacterium]
AGLIRDVESKLTTGVPILMDVPLLGNLFKSTSSTKSKRELMVFITPSIINEGTQMLDQRQEKVLHDLQERKAETATKGVGM